jgi:hypothetical protein
MAEPFASCQCLFAGWRNGWLCCNPDSKQNGELCLQYNDKITCPDFQPDLTDLEIESRR